MSMNEMDRLKTPRRALLYVPGNDERKVAKAARHVDADCVVLDCEDGVAVNRKDQARRTIASLLGEMDFGLSERAVRINPMGSAEAAADLSAVLVDAAVLPDCIVVPKVESALEVQHLFKAVQHLAAQRLADSRARPALITMCESAAGLLALREILEAATAEGAPLRCVGVILGGDDMAASLGARRSSTNLELLLARQMLVLTCRAYGLHAYDIVKVCPWLP